MVSEFKQSADRLRGMLSAGRENLAEAARPEWDKAWAGDQQDLRRGPRSQLPGVRVGHEPPPYDARCPFRGLLAFGVCGPEPKMTSSSSSAVRSWSRSCETSWPSTASWRCWVPSGSGKSSVVLAGLVPTLLGRSLACSGSPSRPATTRSRSWMQA